MSSKRHILATGLPVAVMSITMNGVKKTYHMGVDGVDGNTAALDWPDDLMGYYRLILEEVEEDANA